MRNDIGISVESVTVARSDSPKSLAGNGGASLFQCALVWFKNLWHWRTAWAVKHLSKQLQSNPSFRRSWHANIAMPIYDATHPQSNLKQFDPMPIERCNHIADRLMKHLFGA